MNILVVYLMYKITTIGLLVFFFTGSRKEKTKRLLKKLWRK